MASSPDALSDGLQRVASWGPVERLLHWGPLERLLTWARIDFAPEHRQPRWSRVGLATVLAIVLSLAADAALAAIGKAVFPSTKGFVHYQFADYAKLTVLGVLIGCAAWPIVTRICAAPRWLFFRLAVLVTLVLFLPDLWIWLRGESGQGVLVLVAMHVAIALITYNLLVHLAPVRSSSVRQGRHAAPAAAGAAAGAPAAPHATR
jgi:Family of unknown function (DUF6069)